MILDFYTNGHHGTALHPRQLPIRLFPSAQGTWILARRSQEDDVGRSILRLVELAQFDTSTSFLKAIRSL
jgi:hypothetical protein